MSASVLITYATRAGSTKEVAESIAATMRDVGLWPDTSPMHKEPSLLGQSAILLGAPLYMGRFPREFHQYVASHRAQLHSIHPWIFVLGPTRNLPADFAAARKQALKQLQRYAWLQPTEVHIFGGRWAVQNLPFPFSALKHLPAAKKIPASDIRDWHAIRHWALDIAHQIRPAA